MFSIAQESHKFSLGSFQPDFTESTFWVVFLFGLFINLNNFGIDQSFVQRYHTAKDARQAARSVWLGALLYVPISMLFFLIGTATFAYYQTHPESLEEVNLQVAASQLQQEEVSHSDAEITSRAADLNEQDVGDKVLPHFIVTGLPVGVRGLLIAAIFAAAMSSIDTSFNSSATVILSDIYKRFINQDAGERESMAVLYGATLIVGAIGTAAAVAMIGIESILDTWWVLSGIFAGGLLGLFLLGLVSPQADSRSASIAVILGIIAILWMSLPALLPENSEGNAILPPWLTNPLHGNMTIVVGTTMILLIGALLTKLLPRRNTTSEIQQE